MKALILVNYLLDRFQPEMYALKSIEGKGMGIVATRDISAASTIISEAAVLRERKMTDSSEKYKLMMDDFNALPTDLQSEIVSLSNCFNTDSKRSEIINKYYTNAIKIEGNKKYESGLFPNIARMNHCCSPNAFWIYEDGKMTVRALFDIKCGDEITASYLEPLQYTFEERQQMLLEKYGFQCRCSECNVDRACRMKRNEIIMEYRHSASSRNIDDLEKAIGILDEHFDGYPVVKMNLLSRCADILIERIDSEEGEDEQLVTLCLEYIESSIMTGLRCYGDKSHNNSDWRETRRRLAILRWFGDSNGKCNNMFEKWNHFF